LPGRELPQRRGNLGWRQQSRCHLVQQRLEDVVIAPIDEQHVRLASPQRARRRDAGKAAAHDHDPLSTGLAPLAVGHRQRRSQGARPDIVQYIGHFGLLPS